MPLPAAKCRTEFASRWQRVTGARPQEKAQPDQRNPTRNPQSADPPAAIIVAATGAPDPRRTVSKARKKRAAP